MDADGFDLIDGVEVPYVTTVVACTTRYCPAFGVEHEIKLYVNSAGSGCGLCSTRNIAAGLRGHRHELGEEVWARVKALPEPDAWIQKRNRLNRMQRMVEEAEAEEFAEWVESALPADQLIREVNG